MRTFQVSLSEKKTDKIWSKRQRAGPNGFTPIGRLISVHPNQGEKFYLRLLLKISQDPPHFLT